METRIRIAHWPRNLGPCCRHPVFSVLVVMGDQADARWARVAAPGRSPGCLFPLKPLKIPRNLNRPPLRRPPAPPFFPRPSFLFPKSRNARIHDAYFPLLCLLSSPSFATRLVSAQCRECTGVAHTHHFGNVSAEIQATQRNIVLTECRARIATDSPEWEKSARQGCRRSRTGACGEIAAPWRW